MGDSIIYKLTSGKPNKFLNFLSGFAGLAVPDAVYRHRLPHLLEAARRRPDYDEIRQRVDYYMKVLHRLTRRLHPKDVSYGLLLRPTRHYPLVSADIALELLPR